MFEMVVGYAPFFYDEEDTDDDIAEEMLEQKILMEEVQFPSDMSPAAASILEKVSVIAIKSEALKCHSLLYALECNLPHLVLKHQELD